MALVALALRPSAWPWIALAVFANHVVIVAAGLWPRSRMLGPNLSRIDPPIPENSVYLTFDDGPDPLVTPAVLDELERHQAKATFFCIGRRAERHPELIEEIVRRGHDVQNHSYAHSSLFWFLLPWQIRRDLQRSQELLGTAGGRTPRYFRAPAGIRSPWLQPVLRSMSLQLTSWTRRGFDTATADGKRVVDRLMAGLRAGDILLLHDGSSARGADGRPVVLDALPSLLEGIREAGLSSAALPQGPRP